MDWLKAEELAECIHNIFPLEDIEELADEIASIHLTGKTLPDSALLVLSELEYLYGKEHSVKRIKLLLRLHAERALARLFS